MVRMTDAELEQLYKIYYDYKRDKGTFKVFINLIELGESVQSSLVKSCLGVKARQELAECLANDNRDFGLFEIMMLHRIEDEERLAKKKAIKEIEQHSNCFTNNPTGKIGRQKTRYNVDSYTTPEGLYEALFGKSDFTGDQIAIKGVTYRSKAEAWKSYQGEKVSYPVFKSRLGYGMMPEEAINPSIPTKRRGEHIVIEGNEFWTYSAAIKAYTGRRVVNNSLQLAQRLKAGMTPEEAMGIYEAEERERIKEERRQKHEEEKLQKREEEIEARHLRNNKTNVVNAAGKLYDSWKVSVCHECGGLVVNLSTGSECIVCGCKQSE